MGFYESFFSFAIFSEYLEFLQKGKKRKREKEKKRKREKEKKRKREKGKKAKRGPKDKVEFLVPSRGPF